MITTTISTELFQEQIVRVLAVTYNNGTSKRYLNAEGVPFHIVWIPKDNKQGK